MAEIGTNVDSVRPAQQSGVRRVVRAFVRRLPLARRLYDLVRTIRIGWPSLRAIRLFLAVRPYTMVTDERLRNIYDIARSVEQDGIEGVFVECGVWRGGCAAVMAAVSARSARPVWLFDSFEGLPEPTAADGTEAADYAGRHAGGELRSIGQCVAPLEDVREVMRRVGVEKRRLIVRKGWFQDTLPEARREIGSIALLRLDGDWYESTRLCLEQLYDLVVPGGYVVIDDYDYWEGCRRAVDEFLAARAERVELRPVRPEGFADGRYFVKPGGSE